MRLKFTIAICALLVLGLAVSQADAQGYRISARTLDVVDGGNNQELGGVRLTYIQQGSPHVPANNTIEVTFGGLTITNPTAITFTVDPANANITAAVGKLDPDDDKTKNQKITITVPSDQTLSTGQTLTVSGVRADVSGLENGASIRASVSSSGTSGEYAEETTGGDNGGSIKVSTVKDGLSVTAVTQISQLTCDRTQTQGRMPSLKIEEGFNDAWETNAGDGLTPVDATVNDDTHIRVVVANVPEGVTFRWPGQGNEGPDGTAGTTDDLTSTDQNTDDHTYFANPAPDMHDRDADADTDDTVIASLLYSSHGSQVGDDKTKRYAIYRFAGESDGTGTLVDHDAVKNIFTISPMVMVDTKKADKGGLADVSAQLYPMPKTGDDDDRDTKLSYTHALETKDKGYFVTITDCVTYLLFPFLTCGAQADWTTGIAVANTTADDEAFPVNEGAAAQGGSVMIYAYPKSTADEKMAMGNMSSPEELSDPITATISGNLSAGDTVAVTCNMDPMLAGFEGYAIVRAGFRAAHGMAFVLGNFQDGAAIDVAHGYIALVIPDPEYSGGRAVGAGENLGH